MANQNHFLLFISRLIAPIAAKQGAQRRLNTRNDIADAGVKAAARLPHISAPSSATYEKPYRIPKVPTTYSYDNRPVIAATAFLQVPHPRGIKIHARPLPI